MRQKAKRKKEKVNIRNRKRKKQEDEASNGKMEVKKGLIDLLNATTDNAGALHLTPLAFLIDFNVRTKVKLG